MLAYNQAAVVHTAHMAIPMSHHTIDSVNLKDPRFGFFDQLDALLHRYDVRKGRVDISLGRTEQHAGLTVNEYENLLMQKDLVDVLEDPLRYMARKGKSFLSDPAAMPGKAKHYAIYDLVHIFNELMNTLQIGQSVIERIVSRVFSPPGGEISRHEKNHELARVGQRDARHWHAGTGHISKPHFDSMAKSAWVATLAGHYHHALSMSDRV